MDKEYVFYILAVAIGALDTQAAIGASAGCVFFMMSPFTTTLKEKLFYTIVSLVGGYAGGISMGGQHVMLAAVVTGSLLVMSITVVFKVLEGGNMPDGIVRLLEIIRGFK